MWRARPDRRGSAPRCGSPNTAPPARVLRVDATNEVVVERPAADVFAFLADAENDTAWRPGVLDIARVAGDAPGPGARYRQGVRGPGGRRIDADIETTAYEPDRLVGFRATAGPVRPEGRYELAPAR